MLQDLDLYQVTGQGIRHWHAVPYREWEHSCYTTAISTLSLDGLATFTMWMTFGYQKRLLDSELSTGGCLHGRPKKRFKDTLKRLSSAAILHTPSGKKFKTQAGMASSLSEPDWQVTRWCALQEKKETRQRRKERASTTKQPCPALNISCPHCKRRFRTKMGLISHLHTNLTWPPVTEVIVLFVCETSYLEWLYLSFFIFFWD